MKTPIRKSPISDNKCFEIYRLVDPYFDPNWHFHPEYQLFIVIKGRGTRFVGDNVASFKEGDLIFIGPNLPHLWRSDPEYFAGNKDLITEGIVIYFHESLLSEMFLEKEENRLIKQLFMRSSRGIKIGKEAVADIRSKMELLLNLKGFERIISLLGIIHDLSQIKDYTLLSSPNYNNSLSASDSKRMSAVHAYVMKNFDGKISLDAVAKVANMTPPAFSRYFKRHANKTFSGFLSEIRVGYACKLLAEKELNIFQVCYASGFNTLSNFNRQFKLITGLSPRQYKRLYRHEVQGQY